MEKNTTCFAHRKQQPKLQTADVDIKVEMLFKYIPLDNNVRLDDNMFKTHSSCILREVDSIQTSNKLWCPERQRNLKVKFQC